MSHNVSRPSFEAQLIIASYYFCIHPFKLVNQTKELSSTNRGKMELLQMFIVMYKETGQSEVVVCVHSFL